MSATTTAGGADVRDMLVVHGALRREFRLAPGLVEGVADGDVARAAVVGPHVRLLLDLLHVHHHGEDELLWPLLLERAPEPLVPVVELMERQHEGIEATSEEIGAVLGRWTATAAAGDRDALARLLTDLHAALDEHLRAEEQHVLPLAEQHVTPAEWGRLAQEVKKLPVRVLPIAFGMLMYEGDPEVVRLILAEAPAVPRLLLPHLAPRAYARYARRVHGTPTP